MYVCVCVYVGRSFTDRDCLGQGDFRAHSHTHTHTHIHEYRGLAVFDGQEGTATIILISDSIMVFSARLWELCFRTTNIGKQRHRPARRVQMPAASTNRQDGTAITIPSTRVPGMVFNACPSVLCLPNTPRIGKQQHRPTRHVQRSAPTTRESGLLSRSAPQSAATTHVRRENVVWWLRPTTRSPTRGAQHSKHACRSKGQ